MRCPACRAENNAEPTCRRCKADLAPLVALEARRDRLLRDAARAASLGAGADVVRYAETAHRLRPGPASWRWRAVGHLLRRDFARALACYRRANRP